VVADALLHEQVIRVRVADRLMPTAVPTPAVGVDQRRSLTMPAECEQLV
jgi:hypothetical protein